MLLLIYYVVGKITNVSALICTVVENISALDQSQCSKLSRHIINKLWGLTLLPFMVS